MLEPANPSVQGKAVDIRYRLNGRGQNGLYAEQTGFPVAFSVKVKDPKGNETTLDMQPDPSKPGEVVSKTKYTLQDPGEYRMSLNGEFTGPGLPGGRFTIYQSPAADGDKVLADQGIPVLLRVATPPLNERIGLVKGEAEVPVSLFFVNQQDNSLLAPPAVLNTGATPGVLWRPDNTANLPDQADFTPMSVVGDHLEATLKVTNPDKLTWFSDPALRLHFHPLSLQAKMFAQGVEAGGDWHSAAYPYGESNWTKGVSFAVLILLLLLLLLRCWLWFKKRRLRQQDRVSKREPRLELQFPDNPEFNPSTPWKLKGTDKIKGQPKIELPDGSSWTIQDFSVTRHLADDGVVATVKYCPPQQSGAKKPKPVVATLRASSDDSPASHTIQGLEGVNAQFVLWPGKQQGDAGGDGDGGSNDWD